MEFSRYKLWIIIFTHFQKKPLKYQKKIGFDQTKRYDQITDHIQNCFEYLLTSEFWICFYRDSEISTGYLELQTPDFSAILFKRIGGSVVSPEGGGSGERSHDFFSDTTKMEKLVEIKINQR